MKILNKIKEFLKEVYENSLVCKGFGDKNGITEEEYKMLMYYIENHEEINKKYKSFEKWEKEYLKNLNDENK